jgi:hypothetical protein
MEMLKAMPVRLFNLRAGILILTDLGCATTKPPHSLLLLPLLQPPVPPPPPTLPPPPPPQRSHFTEHQGSKVNDIFF